MNYEDFLLTIENKEEPHKLPLYVQSLWYDAKGNWQKAHSLIDSLDDKNSCWVHAYLHRKEGDNANAAYWYRRAGKEPSHESLAEEWKNITLQLLA